MKARAFWTVAAGRGEIRAEDLPAPAVPLGKDFHARRLRLTVCDHVMITPSVRAGRHLAGRKVLLRESPRAYAAFESPVAAEGGAEGAA